MKALDLSGVIRRALYRRGTFRAATSGWAGYDQLLAAASAIGDRCRSNGPAGFR
jgi:hypothetical protein